MTEPVHRQSYSGLLVTDAMIDDLIAQAEHYDVDELLARRGKHELPEDMVPGKKWTGVNPRFLAVLHELAEERGVPTAEVFDEAVRRFIGLDG